MSFSEGDLQSKIDEMEAELKRESSTNNQESNQSNGSNSGTFPQFEINPSPKVQGWIDSSKSWFGTLPKAGKAAVAIGGVWLGFSILGAVLHVVSSLVSIAVVGGILYVGYRLFSNGSNGSDSN